MIKKVYLLLVLCLTFPAVSGLLTAQEHFSSRYNLSYITMDEGLLHNNISKIYKDKTGFIWIATKGGGLSRYDGYDFVHFHTSSPPASLRSNFIATVCEDNFHRLWIASDEGTDILSLETLQLTPPGQEQQRLHEILRQPTLNIIKDSRGNIWLYSSSSLHRISFTKKGTISSIITLPALSFLINTIALNDVDGDGNIWIGCSNKVYKVSTTGNSASISPESLIVHLPTHTTIHALCKEGETVWIGTNTGLYRYNRSRGTLQYYGHNPHDAHSLSQSYITDIALSPDRQLIVSTFQGLNLYNPVKDRFERITKTTHPAGNSLNSDFINCILADHALIWIGSDVGGVNKMIPRRLSFRNFAHDGNHPASLSPNPVNSVFEDPSGTLWVGTVEGGINKKPKGSEQFTHYTTSTPTRLSHNTVSSIICDNQNRLWAGTWGWGITLLDLAHPGNRVLKYITPREFPGHPVAFIESLCYDSINNGIWIGSNPGISFYDLANDRIINPLGPEKVDPVYKALGAVIDSRGKLWMGSVENGLFIIDLHSRKGDTFSYQHLKYKLDNPESGFKERITCIYEASDHTIWLGSNGNGLYKCTYNSAEGYSFTAYTSKDGLINNSIRGILEDGNGFIWASTNHGLSCFDPANAAFTNYTRADGLINDQFYWNAFYKSASGSLYFGGINGLSVIDSTAHTPASLPSKIVFTRFKIKNEEIRAGDKDLRADISMTKKLLFHEKDNSFSLEFSSLDYAPPPTATYNYRLLGFEKEWTQVPASRRFANYTNIPPGTYTFQVSYAADGRPCTHSNRSELQIVIKPFFYKTGWFIGLVVLVIGCSVASVYVRRLRSLQKQKQILHRMVEERTRELTAQNREISLQKTQLVKMSKKVQELTLDKLSFFTNITHEFRTPITLITGPIERALKLSQNPQVTEQLHFVERNSKYLLSLVNQLMDFRKVESGKQEILKTSADFLACIDSLVAPFVQFASERNITLRTLYHLNNPVFLFDPDAIQKVVTNLLSNAVKFTPDGGSVSVYAALLSAQAGNGKEKLFFCIRDTGTGIKEKDLPHIFNRFYQSRTHTPFPVYGQSGTGIGLYLAGQIVKLHGGQITAHTHKTKGSSFRILLPIERENEKPDSSAAHPGQIPERASTGTHLPPPGSGKQTILIVEDNRDMQKYIRSILEEHYQTLEAENGAEAMTLLLNHPVDFIISDLMMPVMDGMELSRKVKQNFALSHIPFLMLTAKTSPETRIESFRTGVDEYLQKPFSEELLLIRISNILESRKRHQQRFALHMESPELQIDEESKDKKFVDKALRTIHSNYRNSEYKSTGFTEDMGISKSVLTKKMQNLTGQTPGEFIRNYRLHIAYEFLRKNKFTQNMNVSEIAYEVGFNDPKYFTRCFVKRYHMTPSEVMEDKPSGV